MKRCFFAVMLLMGSILLALPAAAVELAPEQVVRNLQRALDTADTTLLDKNVDVEGVLGQAVDVFLQDILTPENQGSLPPMLTMMLSPLGSGESARKSIQTLLQREAAEFVRYGVRSGSFAGKKRETAPPSGVLAPLFAYASLGRKEIRSIGSATRHGDTALVPFTVFDHDNGQTYPVQAELNRQDGQWRMTGVANLPELIKQIREPL